MHVFIEVKCLLPIHWKQTGAHVCEESEAVARLSEFGRQRHNSDDEWELVELNFDFGSYYQH